MPFKRSCALTLRCWLMPFDSLGSFLRTLESAGELARVSAEVSPLLEITEIADRMSKRAAPTPSTMATQFDPKRAGLGGRALLFENVAGSDFPVAINIFGSYHRMETALGANFEAIAERIASLTKPEPPRSIGGLVMAARQFMPLLLIPPRTARRAPCQEVVRLTERNEVDLNRVGLIKCWPLDGDPAAVGFPMTASEAGTASGDGRYITFAGMHTIHADDRNSARPASHNIGMYRAQLIDDTHLAMHWHLHHDGAAHWRSWKAIGQRMPIAICFGGESVLPYAATAPLPPGISELLMAGFLGGRGIRMCQAKTVPLRVPANSEIVIEGWVSTACGPVDWDPRTSDEPLGEGAVFEGPFGDHTGFYSLPDRYPILEVTAVTHRRDAVYPTTIVGLPPMEDYYLGKATERVFLPLLKTIVNDIEDYHLPMFGCFHNCAAISIRKCYALQGRRVMHAVWGAGQMSWTKMIFVVDDDAPLHDEQALFAHVMQRCDFRRDVELVRGPLDILDQAAPWLGAGSKIGFDATTPMSGDEADIDSLAPPAIDDDAAYDSACARVASQLPEHNITLPSWGARRVAVLGVEAGIKHEDVCRQVETLWNAVGCDSSAADFVLVIDAATPRDDFDAVLLQFTACADPRRDRILDVQTGGRRIAFDASSKVAGTRSDGTPVRACAPILAMDKATRDLVDRRWAEYGL